MSTTFLQKNKKNLLEHKKTSSIEESEVSHREREVWDKL